jgi:hypothetical protein
MLRLKHFMTCWHAFHALNRRPQSTHVFLTCFLLYMKPGVPSFLTSTPYFSCIPLRSSLCFLQCTPLCALQSSLCVLLSALCRRFSPLLVPLTLSSGLSFPLSPLPFNALPYAICTFPSTFFSLRSASFLCALSFVLLLTCLDLLFCALLCPPEHSHTHTHTHTYTRTHTYTQTVTHTHTKTVSGWILFL